MAFVVDGSEWNFDGWPVKQIVDAIDNILDRVQTARNRKETIWVGDDLQTRQVLSGFDLWSLCSPTSPIRLPQELWQELAAWLGSAPRYLDEEWPEGMTEIAVQVGHGPIEQNSDVAWAHHNVRAGRAVACLGLRRSGPHITASSMGAATVHWVQDEANNRVFWRAAIDVEGNNADTLERLSTHAFPDLYFREGVWHGLNVLAGGYAALSEMIRKYLTVLDDYGRWVFTSPPPALSPWDAVELESGTCPSNQIIQRRFLGFNLSMAPENPDVYIDKTCRQAREIQIGARTLYCEWHGKLQPHQNRVHVHSPVPESNGKVIIAIFHEHLPTP